MNKKIIVGLIASATLMTTVSPIATTSQAASSYQTQSSINFKDVPNNHYASEAIKWGVSSGLIKGYTNGTFRPSETLTEAQFVALLYRFYGDFAKNVRVNTQDKDNHWADDAYETLAYYKIPLMGYKDKVYRNLPVKRGLIAQAISFTNGQAYDLKGAINYLLNSKISTGYDPSSKDIYKKFGSSEIFTRGQAAKFFYTLHTQGKTKVDSSVLSNKTSNVGDGISVGLSRVDSQVKPNKPTTGKPNGGIVTIEKLENIIKPSVQKMNVEFNITKESIIYSGSYKNSKLIQTITSNKAFIGIIDDVNMQVMAKHLSMLGLGSYDALYKGMKKNFMPGRPETKVGKVIIKSDRGMYFFW